jgi:hypothetical protein
VKRYLLILGTAVAVFGLVAVLVSEGRSSLICKASFAEIQNGMTLAQVEELLGGPERDESTGELLAHLTDEDKTILADVTPPFVLPVNAGREKVVTRTPQRLFYLNLVRLQANGWKEWITNKAIISVQFDDQDKACQKEFLAVYRNSEGLWPMIRRLLHL